MRRAAMMALSALAALAAPAGRHGGVAAETTARPGDAPVAHEARVRVNAEAVRKAMQDEVARSTADLRLGEEARPYYVAYTLSDLAQATVSATYGAITNAHAYRGRVLRTDLRVGDAAFDNTNFEGNAHVETVPLEDDYATLRRELWLRTDEAYKAALETLARKRAAAAGQADEDEGEGGVGDFSKEPPAKLEVPFADATPEPEAVRETVRRLSLLFREFPKIHGSRVTATVSSVRRRMASSEAAWVDDNKRTVRIDVVADTQADDGMRLRSFIPFTAVEVSGLPALAEMEKAVRALATELTAMRTAPVAQTGAGAVLFEGLAAAQITKLLLGDQLSGTPPPKTASATSDDGQQSPLATKLGQKVASPLLSATDDPLMETGPGKVPLFGAYRVDDEGVPAQRVSIIEHGVLKGLLMTRTPRREIKHSNGHARAPRFSGPRAHLGTLVLSGRTGLPRKALLDELGKIARGGGVTTYVVRLLDDGSLPAGDADDMMSLLSFGMGNHGPPPVRPLVVYRVSGGKEQLVRGLTLENLLTRSLKDISAVGKEPVVYNYLDGGGGFSGVPSTIIAPPLLIADVDIRKQTGKNRKPPLYPRPDLAK